MSLRYDSHDFTGYLERSEAYFAAVRDKGDAPWFENDERRAKVADRLGLPADTPALELRRALFERGQSK